MPRQSRVVVAGVPHHVTQRGNRRADVFFTRKDRFLYLKWLEGYCKKWRVDVLAYCLMPNHVHLVLRPHTSEGLERVLRPLHMRYAQYINRTQDWSGHLWQGRFFSSPLDQAYTYNAIRYVERNPVRADIVRRAEHYEWSSASVRPGLSTRTGLSSSSLLVPIEEMAIGVDSSDWQSWLAVDEPESVLNTLRQHANKGLPCGNQKFFEKVERLTGKVIHVRPHGRPIKGSRPL